MKAETLDDLAQYAQDTNTHLFYAMKMARSGDPDSIVSAVFVAQQHNNLLLQALLREGAQEPVAAIREAREQNPIPLHLLSSAAAQRFARLMREAAEACQEMELERGIVDGLADSLDDIATGAEMEVFGPVGLGERQ